MTITLSILGGLAARLALAGVQDETKRTALSFEFFGKTAGPKVLQLFKEGPEGIARMRAEFQDLGGGMGDFVEQAGEVDDNMHRLNLAWTSTKVKIAGMFLPAVNLAIGAFTKLSQVLGYLSKNTQIVQATLAVLSGLAAGKAAAILAAWWPVILPFLKFAAVIGLVILLVEDLMVAWKGGDSLIGRILDRLWGPGSTRKVVAWCKETFGAFAKFFSDITSKPAEFEENWKRTSQSIQNDVTKALGPAFSGVMQAMFEEASFLWDALTGGWENFADKTSAVWDGMLVAFSAVWDEIKFFGLGVVAKLDDAVTGLLNKLPAGLGDALAGSGTAAADVQAQLERVRLQHTAEFEKVGGRLQKRQRETVPAYGAGLIGPPMAGATDVGGVVVNVNGNASHDTARRVGVAAAEGVMKGSNRAAKASLQRLGR
jgi:hypothetical protein